MNSIKPISFEELKNNPIEENKIEDKSKEKEIEKGTLENISNEVRVFPKSSISSLLDHCEKILSYQKLKELKMSASGESISKLIVLVEILKSMHSYLIQDTSLSSEKNERGYLLPKIDIILSQKEPQGKMREIMTEENKKKLMDIWEMQKEKKINNNIQRRPMNNNINNKNNGWNFNRRVFQNNNRNIFVNNRGFRYGNKWQINDYRNFRNFNWRNFNGNYNNSYRRGFNVNQ